MTERRECYELSNLKGWSLVYGRRKVGKTYLVTRCIPHVSYYVVTRQMDVLNCDEGLEIGKAVTQIAKGTKGGKSVVLDEFQRLPEPLWEVLPMQHPSGKLTLLANSLGITKKVFDKNSPLLGLALPYRMDLLHYSDALAHFGEPLNALLFRDPWVTIYVLSWADVSRSPQGFYCVGKGLIGEVFQEEERRFTQIYEAILISVVKGEWDSSIIASRLQSTLSVNGSTVSSYLDSLSKMGLVKKIRVFRGGEGAEWYCTISSPLMSAVLYAEAKHRVSDNDQEVNLTRAIARELQFSVGELRRKTGRSPSTAQKRT
jgi:AAA+ ATPase superfamily predicted ATPase